MCPSKMSVIKNAEHTECSFALKAGSSLLPDAKSPSMVSGPRAPFQRALSMDAKPATGAGLPGRRSAPCPGPIKQESADGVGSMGGADGFHGNAGGCLRLMTIGAPGLIPQKVG